MTWYARILEEAIGLERHCPAYNEVLAVAAYLERRTGECITAPNRRSSIEMASFSVYVIGFIAWAVIPALRGWL